MRGHRGAALLALALAHGLAESGDVPRTAAKVEVGPSADLLQQRLVRSHSPRKDELADVGSDPSSFGEYSNGTTAVKAGEASDDGKLKDAQSEKGAPSKEASESGRPTVVVAPPTRENVLVIVPSGGRGALLEEGGATPAPLIVAPPGGDNVIVVMPTGGKNESFSAGLVQEAAPGGQNLAEGVSQPTYTLEEGHIRASAGGPSKDPPVVVVPTPGKNVLVIMPGNPGSGEAGAVLAATLAEAAAEPTNPPFVVAAPHGENLVVVIPEAGGKKEKESP